MVKRKNRGGKIIFVFLLILMLIIGGVAGYLINAFQKPKISSLVESCLNDLTYCYDSDNSGFNPHIKGYSVLKETTADGNVVITSYQEYCIDEYNVMEYACSSTGVEYTLSDCSSYGQVCQDGECI